MKKTILMILCFGVLFASCKHWTRVVEVEKPVYIHDSTEVEKIVEIHDSVEVEKIIKEYLKGDTVVKEVIVNRYKERVLHDTIVKTEYKEVPVETTVKETETLEVAKPLGWFQKTLMIVGGAAILAVIALLALRFFKR